MCVMMGIFVCVHECYKTSGAPGLSLSARAAIPECHSLAGLSNRDSLSRSSGTWKFKFKVPALSGLHEDFLPSLQMATLLCAHTAFPQCVQVEEGISLFIF